MRAFRKVVHDDIDDQITDAVFHVLTQTREHGLVADLRHLSREQALPYITEFARSRVGLGIDYIAAVIAYAQQLGLIGDYDPRPVAELVARLTHSIMLTPQGPTDFVDDHAAKTFIRSAIVPLIKNGIAPPPSASGPHIEHDS
ncbi:hypothetical protein ACTD5D_17330 [Nocardia takedensis]|uniref:hypothetical protein n=1 Tax=Nocardia takedensis TaxID=259390 RepID=UPI0002E23BD0|nr:hypothetical protein [Nocardia takedensis]